MWKKIIKETDAIVTLDPAGVYPGVIMTIMLRRKISYHLLQTYLPSGLFVIVAWLSLFLPPGAYQTKSYKYWFTNICNLHILHFCYFDSI
jgi:hypothetical protein